MSKTIFTVELPLIRKTEKLEKRREELEKVKEIYPKYDSYFITSGCCKERRDKFDKLWIKYKPYADRHFLKEVRTNFHQRSWEMYVGNVLLEKKLTMQSKNEGPDFVIDKTAYVECVAPTKGDPTKPDSVPEMFIAKTPKEIRVQAEPINKIILRITGAIKDKALDQYENWKNKQWFDSKMPFIIAVNTGDLTDFDDYNMPNVLKALFGFECMTINIKTRATGFSYRDEIYKLNSRSVPVNYFITRDFSFVSGVLFSDRYVLRHPENIGEDCVFVNNPFADNPVDESFVKLFKNWTASKENGEVSLKPPN